MKRLFVFLLLPFLQSSFFQGFSQPTLDQQNSTKELMDKYATIPPSPQAASLGSFGNVPVNLMNGQPSINLPLYSIEGVELSFPISLSYNYSGLKVSEPASWVGLGWMLNGVGVITRSTMGMPDECRNYFNKADLINPYNNPINRNEIENQVFYEKVAKREIETEPDLFLYNFHSYSGSFYIDPYGKVYQTKFEGHKIEKDPCLEGAFIITTLDGTKYYFENYETTDINYDIDIPVYTGTTHFEFISAWYLTRIVSPNGIDTIEFKYTNLTDAPVFENFLLSQSLSYKWRNGPMTSSEGMYVAPKCGETVGKTLHDIGNSTTVDKLFLSEIRLNNDRVVVKFHAVSDRSDFNLREPRLDNIEIFENGIPIKKFELKQTNFNQSALSPDERRMKLDRVEELHYSKKYVLAKPPHSFTYADGQFPDSKSVSSDHWGYYNGKEGLLPKVKFEDMDCIFGEADRESTQDMMMGRLMEMHYPTGGFTRFEFEPNTENGDGKPIIRERGKPIIKEFKSEGRVISGKPSRPELCRWKQTPSFNAYSLNIPSTPRFNDKTEVTLTAPLYVESQHGEDNKVLVGIISSANYDAISSCLFDFDDFYNNVDSHRQDFEYLWLFGRNEEPTTVSLIPGNYMVVMINKLQGVNITLQVKYYIPEEFIENSGPPKVVGGLRINKIDDYDDLANLKGSRQFLYETDPVDVTLTNYTEFKNTGIFESKQTITKFSTSSGVLLSRPVYHSNGRYEYEAPRIQVLPDEFADDAPEKYSYKEDILNIHATSQVGVVTVNGGHLGYLKVREIQYDYESQETNGWTDNYYNVVPESGSFTSPYTHQIEDIFNGDLITQKTFNNAGVLLKQVDYEYTHRNEEYRNSSSFMGYKVFQDNFQDNRLHLSIVDYRGGNIRSEWETVENKKPHLNLIAEKTFSTKRKQSSYQIRSKWKYLKKVNTTEIFNSQQVKTEVTYFYDNDKNLQITKTERKTSDGRVLVEKTKYPNDLILGLSTEAATALIKLKDRYSLNQPVEKILVDQTSNKLIAAERTDFSSNAPHIFKSSDWQAEIGNFTTEDDLPSIYTKRASYTFSAGRMIEFMKQNNFSVSYLWGNDNKIPVAIVKNTTVGSFSFSSFEDNEGKGGFQFRPSSSTDHKTGEKSHILSSESISRDNLVSSSVYVLSYWAKGGTPILNVTPVYSNDNPRADREGWRYFEKTITGITNLTLSGQGDLVIDDLRLYPKGALMTTYTYRQGMGISSITDENGVIQQYNYDEVGRLASITDGNSVIIKAFNYNYKN